MDGSHDPGRLRATIYVLGGKGQTQRWTQQCLAWIEYRGYRLISIFTEHDEKERPGFASGLKMLTDGLVDVMVVATSDYLPTDWVPRLEVAGGSEPFAIPPGNRPPDAPRQRRARPVRRPE